MEGSTVNRKKEFKKGITSEDATEKRRNKQVSIRKKKKEDRIALRRNFKARSADNSASNGKNIEPLLPQFNQQAVLQGEDRILCFTHLSLLCAILQCDQGRAAEKYLRQIFCIDGKPVVLNRVVELFATGPTGSWDLSEIASWCLSSLSGTSVDAELWNSAIRKAGFDAAACKHISCDNIDIRNNIWAILSNMMLCDSNVTLEMENSILPGVCFEQLGSLLQVQNPSVAQQNAMRWLIFWVSNYVERREALPPWNQVCLFFPHLLHYFKNIPHIRFEALPGFLQDGMSLCLSTLAIITLRCIDIDYITELYGGSDLLECLLNRAQQIEFYGSVNFRRCMHILSEFTTYDPDACNATHRILQCNGIQTLKHAIASFVRDTRIYAVTTLALMAQDSVDVAFAIFDSGIMDDISQFKKNWGVEEKKIVAALYCNMIQILFPNSETNSADRLDKRSGAFHALVNKYRCISAMCEFLKRSGYVHHSDDLVKQIIGAIGVAMFWDEPLIKARFEECGGLDALESLGSNGTTEVFEKANRLLDRFYSGATQQDEAYFDSNMSNETAMEWGQPMHSSNEAAQFDF